MHQKGFIYIGIIYYDNVHKVLCVTKLIIQRVQIPFVTHFQPKTVFKNPFKVFCLLLCVTPGAAVHITAIKLTCNQLTLAAKTGGQQ